MSYTDLGQEYRTLDPLQVRIDTHRRHSERPDDPERAVLDAIELAPGAALLDVGCGTGSFLGRLRGDGHRGRLVGVDTSAAALEAVAALEPVAVEAVPADATALPFADASFEVVCARHMLYHVAEPARAVAEAHRVLAPGGWFAAVVNVPGALPQTAGLLRTVLARHGVAWDEPAVHAEMQAELIAPVFGDATTVVHANALIYPDADALARYCVAMLGLYGVDERSPIRDAVVGDVAAEARRRVDAAGGSLRDPKGFAVTIARR